MLLVIDVGNTLHHLDLEFIAVTVSAQERPVTQDEVAIAEYEAKRAIDAALAAAPAERSEEIQAAALQMRRAMASDPWARRLAIAAAILIATLAINYVG